MTLKIKKDFINLVSDESYKPLKKEVLATIFDISPSDMSTFYDFIKNLEENGEISISKKGRISVQKKTQTLVGKFISNRKGFGFVEFDDDKLKDLFIPADNINGAMHGDTVMAEIIAPANLDKRAEGNITKIIKREIDKVVGTFETSKSFGFVVPDNKKFSKDIFIPKRFFSGARTTDKVVCKITVWPDGNKKPEGKIIEVLGKKGDRKVEIDSIIREHGLSEKFPQKVEREAEALTKEISQEEINRRKDIRHLNIFTIDGEDAKDLDDAISVEILKNGNYKLGVHIADVTHYIKEKSKIDEEAFKRATSVYLVDKVIPMLPKTLSNGVCSLNANEDKLALSIFMEIDVDGNIVDHEIVETIINSKARMTYTEVSNILGNNDEKLKNTFSGLVDEFQNAEKLSNILMKKRRRRGSIDFDFPESKIILNKEGRVVDIKEYERGISNKIIEEFMLISNETIAEHFNKLKIPFVYRVHENPTLEKMQLLNDYIATFGYHIKGKLEDVNSKELQEILDKIKGKNEERSVSTIMLRSFKQAKYSPDCSGHFGLAAKYYTHFTSPIRRYPDLQIHRIIKEALNNKIDKNRRSELVGIVDSVSTQSSEQERNAELVERDVTDFYKTMYMSERIGEVFTGNISGVTSFGIFVELQNTVEGLVRLSELKDDYYNYVEEKHMVIGERSNKTYKIGDSMNIKVEKVDVDLREIDFSLIPN